MTTSFSPLLYEGQLRMARYYADLISRMNQDYARGFEASVAAVRRFTLERIQFEKSVAWLIAHLDDDEVAKVFVDFLASSYQVLYARFDVREFQTWLEKGLKAARRLGNLSAEAGICIAMGFIAQSAGAYQQSIDWFEQARTIAQEIGNRFILANSLHAMATSLRSTGQAEKTSAMLEQAYHLHCELGNLRGMQSYLFERGYSFFHAGELDKSLDLLEQTYQLALQTEDYREIARTLATTGLIYNTKGQYAEAITIYQQALEFAEAIDFPPVLIYVLHAIANSYTAVKNLEASYTCFLRALHLAEANSFAANAASIQTELGTLARKQGRYEEALLYVNAALTYHRSVNNTYDIAIALCQLSLVYASLGDDTAALLACRESLEVMDSLQNDVWTLNAISTTIEVFTVLAAREDTDSRFESAALWAGFLITHPGVDQGKIDLIAALRPEMERILTPQRTEHLFNQGATLTLNAIEESMLAQI